MWHAVKAVFKGKLIALNARIRKVSSQWSKLPSQKTRKSVNIPQ